MKNEYSLRLKKTAIILGMILAGSLTGCGSKNNVDNQEVNSEQEFLLKDTIFERAFVATVDGEVAILRKEDERFWFNPIYFDIVNGENISKDGPTDEVRMCEKIVFMSSIFEYLTEEDIKKLANKEFTKEDEVELICRIKVQVIEENNDQKVNKLTNEN